MPNTYNQIFTKGIESQLVTTPVVEGKIRYTTDTNRLFIDGATTRQEISDIIRGYTAAEIEVLQNPLQNKFYLSSNTKLLYYYNGSVWNTVSIDAASAAYDNTESGYTSTTLQDAIDEVISKKLDKYTTISYADWLLLTPQQQAAKNYYIPDYPNEGLTMSADAVTYSNTTSGLVSIDAQGAIDEIDAKVDGHTHSVTTISVGSASEGTAITADDITAWSAGTLPSLTYSAGVVTFSAGSLPSLTYTERTIPNISVTSKTVVTAVGGINTNNN